MAYGPSGLLPKPNMKDKEAPFDGLLSVFVMTIVRFQMFERFFGIAFTTNCKRQAET